jgi:arylsulfatase A-like enzyme
MRSITRRDFLATQAAAVSAAAPQKTPNLVFLLSDQQAYDMLGCYGNRQIITPNIDRLATQGTRFKYCISNSPVCTPYRGIFFSGQHPLHTGALGNDLQMVPGGGRYLGEVLRDAGYRLGYFGKWHLYGGDRVRPIPPGPYRYGFDNTFLSNNCTLLFDKERAYYWDEKGDRKLYGDWEPFAQTRQALKFLDETSPDQPFALFVSWHPPHNWRGAEKYPAPEELLRPYDQDSIKVRGNCENTDERREAYRGYMAMCTSLDTCTGWVMKKLEEKGLADNTILVYTSDHGDLLLSHGLTGNKGRVENESMHVPLIIRHPQLAPRVSELMIGTLYLMPTLLGLMGLQAPSTCQGRDLATVIRQKKDDAVESLPLFLFVHDWRGIYTRRYSYSYLVNTNTPNWWNAGRDPDSHNRLFDRQADPLEMKNLFHDPAHKELRRSLHEKTLTWMKKFGDTGLSYPDIVSKVEVDEDLAIDRTRELTHKGAGRLKGRPIDHL